MIRFLQTPGPMLKIILGGVLLIICGSMVITLVPGGLGSAFGFGGPPRGVVARVAGGEGTTPARQREGPQKLWEQKAPGGGPAAPVLSLFAPPGGRQPL